VGTVWLLPSGLGLRRCARRRWTYSLARGGWPVPTRSNAALIERALALAGTFPDDRERSWALEDIAEELADADPVDPALIDEALAVAETIPHDQERSWALAAIAGRSNPAL
jgi:hypothetical protein